MLLSLLLPHECSIVTLEHHRTGEEAPNDQVASYINTVFGNELFVKFSNNRDAPPALIDSRFGGDQYDHVTHVQTLACPVYAAPLPDAILILQGPTLRGRQFHIKYMPLHPICVKGEKILVKKEKYMTPHSVSQVITEV